MSGAAAVVVWMCFGWCCDQDWASAPGRWEFVPRGHTVEPAQTDHDEQRMNKPSPANFALLRPGIPARAHPSAHLPAAEATAPPGSRWTKLRQHGHAPSRQSSSDLDSSQRKAYRPVRVSPMMLKTRHARGGEAAPRRPRNEFVARSSVAGVAVCCERRRRRRH